MPAAESPSRWDDNPRRPVSSGRGDRACPCPPVIPRNFGPGRIGVRGEVCASATGRISPRADLRTARAGAARRMTPADIPVGTSREPLWPPGNRGEHLPRRRGSRRGRGASVGFPGIGTGPGNCLRARPRARIEDLPGRRKSTVSSLQARDPGVRGEDGIQHEGSGVQGAVAVAAPVPRFSRPGNSTRPRTDLDLP